MKKYLIISLLLFVGLVSVSAQKKAPAKPARVMILNKIDKNVVKYPVSEIESVTFGYEENAVESPAVADQVDLGLSVKWASFNLGATSEKEAGYMTGWGDNTLVCKSQNLNYYPTKYAPTTLIGTDYDVAQLMWEDKWRMPTAKEFQELIDNCDWTWDDEKQGFLATSKVNSATLFFPVGGYRNGEAVPEDSKLNGYYWTAMLSNPNTHAKAAVFHQVDGKDVVEPQDMERYLGLMIRPVYGDYVLPLSVSAELQGTPGYSNMTVRFAYDGDAKGTTLYGIAYELMPSDASKAFDLKKASKASKTGEPTLESENFELTGLDEGKQYRAMAFAIIGTDTVRGTEMVTFTTDARYVDLGLSVKWAKWNIGAENTNELGGYYGWGDITGELKSPYAINYAKGNTSTSIAGNANYDLAVAKWGGRWRMPTKAEFEEMVNAASTSWTYDGSTGVTKYIATFPNGETLEFPYDGYMNSTCTEKAYETHGFYWTATATSDQMPYYFHMSGPRSRSFTTAEKYMHVLIRPVYDEGQAPVTPDTPADDTTKEASPAVDLGLYSGNLWATYNVGATKETQSGVYVAWGELQEKKSEGYYQNNYAYLDENNTQYGGYSTALGLNIAMTDYDIAHVRWKGDWQMPTDADFKELRNDCTWTAETRSGVFGYKVTGPNGKSIFLPCAGYYNGMELISENVEGNYWCSTMYMFAREYQMGYAMNLHKENGYELSRYSRKGGCTVRPVKHKK